MKSIFAHLIFFSKILFAVVWSRTKSFDLLWVLGFLGFVFFLGGVFQTQSYKTTLDICREKHNLVWKVLLKKVKKGENIPQTHKDLSFLTIWKKYPLKWVKTIQLRGWSFFPWSPPIYKIYWKNILGRNGGKKAWFCQYFNYLLFQILFI